MTSKATWTLAVTLLALTTAAFGQPLESTLDARVPQALKEYSVPGAAVALLREGRVTWMRGFGVADVRTGRPVTPDTLFNVGSISKSATAFGVMRLAELGRIDLDRPIDDYLERWQVPPSSFDARQVTARRLLSHTAGISAHGYGGSAPEKPVPSIEDSLNGKTGTGAVMLVAEPGKTFAYSGANYLILQLAIEDITGLKFEQYMKHEVFKPARLSATRFDLPAPGDRAMAAPHDAFSRPLPLLRYPELSAAGLTTSLRDLSTLAVAGLRAAPARGALLKQATLQRMRDPVANTQWAERDPYGPAPAYGLGLNVRPEQFRGRSAIGHGGTNDGWESWWQVVPETGDGIVILTNSSNGGAVIAAVLCEWRKSADANAECPAIAVKIPLLAAYRSSGIDAALGLYDALRQREAASYDFSVSQLNSLGYQVMRAGDLAAAVKIFRLNTQAYPDEWNVFDSYGEALRKAGDIQGARDSYRKSVELNPGNENGRQVLAELEKHTG